MRSISRVSGFFIMIYLMASCSPTVKVSSDYDRAATFTGYKTFSMYDLKTQGSVSPINAERIANAIKANMISKGFTETATNPDIMVNALTFVKDKQSVTANTNYYGYGGMYRPYGYWGGGMASGTTTYNTYDYKDGSLIIDIVDAKSQKVVWQGTGNAEIDSAPKNPDEWISNAVAKIMAQFPPGAKK